MNWILRLIQYCGGKIGCKAIGGHYNEVLQYVKIKH